jgi:thiol-disulfide isomerase/thioredoxin
MIPSTDNAYIQGGVSMRGSRTAAAVLAIGAAIALTGCGTEEKPPAADAPPATQTSEQAPADDAPASTPQAEPAPVVPEQLKFTAKTLDGKDFDGASLAGKPAVLWFWAPWCPNCQAEAPAIAEAAKSVAGSVSFVGVAAQDDVSKMREFVSEYEVGAFPHLADTDAAVWKRFGVTYQPAYAFISADGTFEVETNPLEKQELLDRVSSLA